jgi:hypothetical protein
MDTNKHPEKHIHTKKSKLHAYSTAAFFGLFVISTSLTLREIKLKYIENIHDSQVEIFAIPYLRPVLSVVFLYLCYANLQLISAKKE